MENCSHSQLPLYLMKVVKKPEPESLECDKQPKRCGELKHVSV